jgi:hypothetical protein
VLFFFGIQEIFSIVLDWLPKFEDVVEKKGSSVPRVVAASVLGLALIGGGVWWITHEDKKVPMVTALVHCLQRTSRAV